MIHLTEPEHAALMAFVRFPEHGFTDEHGRRLLGCSQRTFTRLRENLEARGLLNVTGEFMTCKADRQTYPVYRLARLKNKRGQMSVDGWHDHVVCPELEEAA